MPYLRRNRLYMNQSKKVTLGIVSVLILMATLGRILPHPPNFTPLAAVALFGGFYLSQKHLGLLLPLICLFFSDLLLQASFYLGLNPFPGFHTSMVFVYGAFLLIALLGTKLKGRLQVGNLLGATAASSVLFYLLTNFGVWIASGMYPRSIEGLLSCYSMGLPFLGTGFLGDLCFVTVIFGAYYFSPIVKSAKA